MPVFEYVCTDCGKVCEVLLKASSDVKPQCQHCGSKNLKKLLSGFSVGRSKQDPGCAECSSGCSTGECWLG